MDTFIEFWSAATHPINLPLSVLLALTAAYWLVVLLGVFDIDLGFGGHHGHGAGEGMDGLGGDHGHVDGFGDGHGHGGVLHSVTQFLHLGEAPSSIVFSVLITAMWAFSVLVNHYFNPNYSLLWGLVLLVPNLVVAAVLTRYLTLPLKKVYGAMNKDWDDPVKIVGQVCQVTTLEVTKEFGQASLEIRGAPLLLNVRLAGDGALGRGDQALVVSVDKEKNLYQVIKFEQPQLEN